MRRSSKVLVGFLGGCLALGLPWALFSPPEAPPAGGRATAGGANPAAVEAAFQSWSADHDAKGGDRSVRFSLGWSRGYSREASQAGGYARLDLLAGTAEVELRGLAPGDGWDIWLVENSPGGGALADRGDRIHRLGRVKPEHGNARLSARLGSGFFNRFQADLMVVTRAGGRPEDAGVLFGSPDLFQRLYTERRTKLASLPSHLASDVASIFGPRIAQATAFDSLDPMVALGAELFEKATFDGNGRTCATCHPPKNNFTIDPKFIFNLPANDPLFVFENNPALAQHLENGTSLRELGLVLENVDGTEDLPRKFVLRGVPHTLGLMVSRKPQPGSTFEPIPPVERLGWGGDGAPGSGSLRDFALGAIIQHATRTLTRNPGVDFRVPTDQELDAMAAFQLALGRQEDPDLAAMVFRSPIVTRGQVVYMTGDSAGGTQAAGKCNRCHFNGGSNVTIESQNRNFDVGIEQLPSHPANLIQPGSMPFDAGFGREPNALGGFGNGRFNSVAVVEAADTGPFFHNNAVQTIEEAVDFYNTNAFNNSPAALGFRSQDTGGIGIHLETTDVEAVAALLRVLNALENIRSSSELDRAALSKGFPEAKRLIDLASFDTEDAFQVLEERSLHLSAVRKLKEAHAAERAALGKAATPARNRLLEKVLMLKEQARAEMLVRP